MATTFKFGNGNWAVKEDYALAYNDENGNFKPLPFDFTRASTATRVNKNGLIETVPSGKPRIDFTDNTSGHLLLEPSRTNNVTYSEDFTQWTKQSITDSEISLVSNSLTGSVDASELEDTSTSNYARLTLNTTTLASTAYRFSCFVKKTTGVQTSCPAFQLEIGHDYLVLNTTTGETKTDALDAGNTNYSDINVIDFNSEWWKLEMTATSVGTSTRVAIYPAFTGTFGSSASSSNIGTVTIYGIQVEQGSYATSYIPTSGSTVTRSAETLVQSNIPDIFNRTAMSVYMEIEALSDDSTNREITISDGSSSDRYVVKFTSSDTINTFTISSLGSTGYSATTTADNPSITQFNKIGVSFNSSVGYLYVNGTEIESDTVSNVIGDDLTKISFANAALNNNFFYGKIKDLRVYDTALSDSELQALTS